MISVLEQFGLIHNERSSAEPDTVTYNGNPSFSTIGSAHLDFYGGVTRQTKYSRIVELSERCIEDDLRLFIPTIFQKRNCREGAGERLPFITAISQLPVGLREQLYPIIPKYGYWDDLNALARKIPTDQAYLAKLMAAQLLANMLSMSRPEMIRDRNLEKWLPTEKGSDDRQWKAVTRIITAFNEILSSKPARGRTRFAQMVLTISELRQTAIKLLQVELDNQLKKIDPYARSLLLNIVIEGKSQSGFKVFLVTDSSSSTASNQSTVSSTSNDSSSSGDEVTFADEDDPRFKDLIDRYDHILTKARALPENIHQLNTTGYRKWLAYRRAHDAVVEHYKSDGHWGLIDYAKVPSIAFDRTKKQFQAHDKDRFEAFMEKVKTGQAKINVGRLMPFELLTQPSDEVRDQQWRLLVESTRAYYRDVPFESPFHPINSLHVADVSGSMTSGANSKVKPIDVSRSLALLMAEVGQRALYTFSGEPKRYEPTWSTLTEALSQLRDDNYTTNFHRLIDRIFDDCQQEAEQKQVSLTSVMPGSIVVYTDGGFDHMCRETPITAVEYLQNKFASAGLTEQNKVPLIVFWNVAGNASDFSVQKDTPGMIQLAGFSKDLYQLFSRLKTVDELNPEIFFRADVLSSVYQPVVEVYDRWVQRTMPSSN